MAEVRTRPERKFTYRQRIEIGCAYNSESASASELAAKHGCSVQYIYLLGREAKAFMEVHIPDDEEDSSAPVVRITRMFLEMVVVVLTCVCQASLEDVSIALKMLFTIKWSVTKISGIRKKYALIAEAFNGGVDLSTIKVGANDEIFFGQTPILTGIDLVSHYVYCFSLESSRDADTWALTMLYLHDQGLLLDTTINDAGTGLMCGIMKAFPNVQIQIDVFHIIMDFGVGIQSVQNKIMGFLGELYRKEASVHGKKVHQKTVDVYLDMLQHVNFMLDMYDILDILLAWVKEILAFSGYGLTDTVQLLNWIAEEVICIAQSEAVLDCSYLKMHKAKYAAETLLRRIPQAVTYISSFYDRLDKAAEANGVDPMAYHLAYNMRALLPHSERYGWMACKIDSLVRDTGKTRAIIEQEVQELIASSHRASSMVENLNSRIRTALNDGRGITPTFAELLKLYINTKPLRRSYVEDRIGKSPLERLNGDKRGFLDILFPGFCPVMWIRPNKRKVA